ncbi:hypothetical protein JVU11DRAFT_2069 [Chiua virens]|nr:hypothetical protein JVU11DRAFT_2069 [Chiua virens]
MSAQTTPSRTVTPASSVSLSSGKDLGLDDQGNPKVNFKTGDSDSSGSEDAAGLSSPPMSPSSVLRKDSQGFGESVNPVSLSSPSLLSLSPTEGKMGSRLVAIGWTGEEKAPVL